jgi:tetratricopeptide (TPR) repeat protein
MRISSGRLLAVLSALGFLLAASALWASERSEVLVARGQVAYAQGHYEEARALFAEAVAADPADADARYALGLALGKLGRWADAATAFDQTLTTSPSYGRAREARDIARRAAESGAPPPEVSGLEGPIGAVEEEQAGAATDFLAGRRWSVYASTGMQYDSNVTLSPTGQSDGDGAGVLAGGGRYDLVQRDDALFRVEYDLYQTLHFDIDDFDFRWQRIQGTGSYAFVPWLWAGAQGGYNHYTLGPHSYLGEPFVMPFVSFLEHGWGMSQLTYRYGSTTYFSSPFHDIRDSLENAVGATQTFYFAEGSRYLTLGYQYGRDDPYESVGNDYKLMYHQAFLGGGFPAWWNTRVELLYLFRYDDYTKRNSVVNFRKTRQDSENNMFASISRPITDHIRVVVSYTGIIHPSNINLFDYRRNVVAGLVEISY